MNPLTVSEPSTWTLLATVLGLFLTVVAVVKVVLPAAKLFSRGWRKFTGSLDAIVGRDAITDPADGRVLAPALPGIGQRMSTVEDAVKTLTQVVADQRELRDRVDAHETRLNVLEPTVATLVAASAERAATAAAAAQAMRLVNDRDVIDGDSTET